MSGSCIHGLYTLKHRLLSSLNSLDADEPELWVRWIWTEVLRPQGLDCGCGQVAHCPGDSGGSRRVHCGEQSQHHCGVTQNTLPLPSMSASAAVAAAAPVRIHRGMVAWENEQQLFNHLPL